MEDYTYDEIEILGLPDISQIEELDLINELEND